ncbi:LysR substrate-binding domain-containing protein [Paraburkholderia sacchari]|uniref:LysR substrate-binding domain-containing protein n=1 Tax=Paraburkholderia sacchari TaxID=159450 RepID=UPI0039A68AEE
MNDRSATHSAALDGFGIILGYEHALAADLAQGRFLRVLPEYEGPSRPLHVLYGNDQRTTPKVCRFVEMLIDRFPASATSARP